MNLAPGTIVQIIHPPGNFEAYTQDGEVVSIEDGIITVKFLADQIRTCRFHQSNGTCVDTRLEAFIVLADPTRF